MSELLTKRGRPRRRHWWREFATSTYRDARDAWEVLRETGECMQLEDDEFRELHPAPTFKATLIGLRGHGARWHTAA